jgi:subtilisin
VNFEFVVSFSNVFVSKLYMDVGTHYTGMVVASDNELGVVGVAPDLEIFIARIFSPNGEFHSSDMITGLEACHNGGANVIPMSLGGPFPGLQEEVTLQTLYNQGIVSVASKTSTTV